MAEGTIWQRSAQVAGARRRGASRTSPRALGAWRWWRVDAAAARSGTLLRVGAGRAASATRSLAGRRCALTGFDARRRRSTGSTRCCRWPCRSSPSSCACCRRRRCSTARRLPGRAGGRRRLDARPASARSCWRSSRREIGGHGGGAASVIAFLALRAAGEQPRRARVERRSRRRGTKTSGSPVDRRRTAVDRARCRSRGRRRRCSVAQVAGRATPTAPSSTGTPVARRECVAASNFSAGGAWRRTRAPAPPGRARGR